MSTLIWFKVQTNSLDVTVEVLTVEFVAKWASSPVSIGLEQVMGLEQTP